MATPEEFAELRNVVSELRNELEIIKVSVAAAQEAREADAAAVQGLPTREELNDHMNLIDKKVDEDNQVYQDQVKKLQEQLADQQVELVRLKESTTSSVVGFSPKPSRSLGRLGRRCTSPNARGLMVCPLIAEVPNGRTGGSLPLIGSAKKTRISRVSSARLRS